MNLLPPSQLQAFLPDELITEVLSFLSVKSLMRLKCLSKSWKYLMSEPYFAKLHLNRTTQNAVLFPLLKNPARDPYYQLTDKDCRYIIGSCNGLLCLFGGSEYRADEGGTISEKLDLDDGLDFPSHFKFGYDNSTETYKVVYFTPETTNVRVFSLGVNVWRNIQDSPMTHHLRRWKVVYVRGSVNWLAIHNYIGDDYNCKGITIEQFVIISLDLGTEAHTKLLLQRKRTEQRKERQRHKQLSWFLPQHGSSPVPLALPRRFHYNHKDYNCSILSKYETSQKCSSMHARVFQCSSTKQETSNAQARRQETSNQTKIQRIEFELNT
ncbi:F-box and associated interaction domain protein [Medicago truncatula]|uniref:F-box and associated interaction domain protein n=1 Tax=Medicago truncatula TaxID=3880 RepID=G7L4H8_MEDTR|nr:F-box and associated interaction domain protein [Medicago truncatula]